MLQKLPKIVSFALAATLLWTAASAAAAADAYANPGKVAELIGTKGRSGVVRGPHTISKEQKAALEPIAATVAKRYGGRAFFVLLPADADDDEYVALYDGLGMKGADFLAVSNGKGLALRCNALGKQAKEAAWKAFRDAPPGPTAKFTALVAALPAKLTYKPGAEAPAGEAAEEGGGGNLGTTLFVLFVIGAVAVVIVRRKNRDTAIATDFAQALDPVESDLADMYLSMDGLEQEPGFDQLVGQATALSEKVDVVKAEAPSRQGVQKLETMGRDAAWLKSELNKLGK